ncbi:MAG: CDGSH iron-sulfur domain-containing protein [Candidatus Omnitrophica bacterium]|nr:CDGSH iron-sulfur domain-containing protein [Candidatus Omnitrophota bacterium]
MKKDQHNEPYTVRLEAGRYAWCTCGVSKKQPFCDGSHGPTGMRPYFFEITEAQTVLLCGCKVTSKKPFCDGTHKKYAQ